MCRTLINHFSNYKHTDHNFSLPYGSPGYSNEQWCVALSKDIYKLIRSL